MPSTPEVKLSIVVAMYNIEGYIRYCLESCLNQQAVQRGDYEVIAVNDGSTDGSLGVAEEIAAGAHNVRIVSQDNAGLSAARNTGMAQARGEYIWFVDGDDAIAPNAVATILAYIAKDGADAYICNFSTFETADIIETSNFRTFDNLSGAEIHEKYLHILPLMAWLTIYKTDRLRAHDLQFLPGIIHEDFEFSVRAHHLMETISFIKESLYRYRVARKDSIMDVVRKDNTKSLTSTIATLDSFETFFAGEDTRFVRKLLGICASSFYTKWYDKSAAVNGETTRLFCENKKRLQKLMWHSGQWKKRIFCVLETILPRPVLCDICSMVRERFKLM